MLSIDKSPFWLNKEQIEWVTQTLAEMTLEAKVGQVFCPMGFTDNDYVLNHNIREIGIGGLMYRSGPADYIQSTHRKIQDMAKIPLLLAANIEEGGKGLALEGTSFGCAMAVAATADPENSYYMGYAACAEGAALGLNWSFAPVVDIDMDFHNPITNTRTFGSDPNTVIACASRYMDAADENGVAVSIKHFPGDGVDERDQHLLTSVNSLGCEEWQKSYGKVYKALIEKGAKTVMVGHIAQPALTKALNPKATREETLRPASLNPALMNGLLREKLGFNGVISTDATPMVGFCAAMPRSKAIPTAVAAGADIILFNKDLDEDYRYLMEGVESGIVSKERLDEAVTRILALKASLNLHSKQKAGLLVPSPEQLQQVGHSKFKKWADKTADCAITLVQDKSNLLPISPLKYPRIYLNVIQKETDPENAFTKSWKQLLENEGFQVTVRDRSVSLKTEDFSKQSLSVEKQKLMHEMYRSVEEMKKEHDLYIYVVNMENASNNTTLRLNWNVTFGLGDDAPWMTGEIPVMMISTAYPYHLFDAPMIPTYINAYNGQPRFRQAVIEKIMGRSEFKGISPSDPYCGKEWLR